MYLLAKYMVKVMDEYLQKNIVAMWIALYQVRVTHHRNVQLKHCVFPNAEEYGADVVIARPCHIYGPYFTEQDNRVYAQFIRNVLRDEDIVMKSTGEHLRSWCYVVDCVSALLYILIKRKNGEAYNIADSNSNISIRDLAEIIAGIGKKKVIMDLPDDDEKRGYNIVKKSTFSTTKLDTLGWQVKVPIIQGLENTIQECMEM